jgi:hypothetical protein
MCMHDHIKQDYIYIYEKKWKNTQTIKSVYHFDHVNISKDDMIKLPIIKFLSFMSTIISLNLLKFSRIQ